MIFGGGALLVDNRQLAHVDLWSGFISVFGCGGMGLVPFRLPQFMYPEGADGETAMA